MGSSHLSFTKICKSCGQQKPLSAFLQLAEGKGTGNICISCRKTNKEQESTSSTTGKKIDSKAKVQGETDKRELRKQIEENYFEERDEKGERQIKYAEKKVSAEHTEKKIRSFLENRAPYKKSYTSEKGAAVGSDDLKNKVEFDKGPVDHDRVPQVKTILSEPYKRFKIWLKGSPVSPIVKAADKAAKQKPSEKPELAPLNEFTKKRF